MNKKQLIVAWVVGIMVIYICGFMLMQAFVNTQMNLNVHYNVFQTFILMALPPLIIGGLLIYTLRWRRGDTVTGRKISLRQVIIVLGIIIVGLIGIHLPQEITNRPPWSLISFLVVSIFYLTVIGYPVYLILIFLQWIIQRINK